MKKISLVGLKMSQIDLSNPWKSSTQLIFSYISSLSSSPDWPPFMAVRRALANRHKWRFARNQTNPP